MKRNVMADKRNHYIYVIIWDIRDGGDALRCVRNGMTQEGQSILQRKSKRLKYMQ